MIGGTTFRQAIDNNKKQIVAYLELEGGCYTSDICKNYKGEHEQTAVRKALNELRKENIVTTDDKVAIWKGKRWELKK